MWEEIDILLGCCCCSMTRYKNGKEATDEIEGKSGGVHRVGKYEKEI